MQTLKESLPTFFRQSAAYRELEQQAAERVEIQRAQALSQLADCDVRHSATIPPLDEAIEEAAAGVQAAVQALQEARQTLSRAQQAKQAAYWPIDRERDRLTALLETELCPQAITDAVEHVDAEIGRMMNYTPAETRTAESSAKYRAVSQRLQSLRSMRADVLALRTQQVDDLGAAISRLWATIPGA